MRKIKKITKVLYKPKKYMKHLKKKTIPTKKRKLEWWEKEFKKWASL